MPVGFIMPEIDLFATVSVPAIMAVTFATVAAAGVATFALPMVRNRVLPKPVETRLSDFIAVDALSEDGTTIVCKDQSTLAKVIEFEGIDQSFLKEGEHIPLFIARRVAIESLTEEDVTLRFIVRRLPTDNMDAPTFRNEIATNIASQWKKGFRNVYVTKMFVVIDKRNAKGNEKRFGEIVDQFMGQLAAYKPRLVTQDPAASIDGKTTITSFLSMLSSPCSLPSPQGTGNYLAQAICADSAEFRNDGIIEFQSGDNTKYVTFIGIRRMGDNTSTLMANELIYLPFETSFNFVVKPVKKASALIRLKQNQRMMSMTSLSPSVGEQYDAAVQLVEGLDETRACLCDFSETITVYADSEKELEIAEAEVRKKLNKFGFTGIREAGAAQASFFMQFPSTQIFPRGYRLMSTNVAQLVTLDAPDTGYGRSAWGTGPIATFKTASGSIYRHQFHVTDDLSGPPVAHGLAIAPTGGGKTTLFSFLSLMASRHRNVKSFFMDRLKGAYIYTTAMNGKYLNLNADPMAKSVIGGMNPFQCEDTKENRDFLNLWLRGLTGLPPEESTEEIARAVDIAFSGLDSDSRSLAMIYEAAFTPNSPVAKALRAWVDKNQYGEIFNAEKDALDFSEHQLVTFDMTSLFSDSKLASAAIAYILHKIRRTLMRNNSAGLIFIDETEPLVRDPLFRSVYLVLLQEFRKINGAVISVFQRPEALRSVDIAQAVRQQSGVYYLWPNPGAAADDYEDFDLNDREMAFILGKSNLNETLKRGLLIKRPALRKSVVIDTDLASLGPYLQIFSSSTHDVQRASECQEKNPNAWIDDYLRIAPHYDMEE